MKILIAKLDSLYSKLENEELEEREEIAVFKQISKLRESIKNLEKNEHKQIRKETLLAVYGVETIKEISEQFRVDYKLVKNDMEGIKKAMGLFQKYVLSITFMYSITSIKNNLGFFRKIISEEGGLHEKTTLESFKVFDIYTLIKEDYDKKLTAKEEQEKEMALDVKSEIEEIKKTLNNKTYSVKNNQDESQVRSYYISYLLGLSTGRRFTEILKTVELRKKGDNYIFTGILKKEKTEDSKAVAYLLDISIEETKGYIKEIRTFINAKLKGKKLTLKTATEADINRIFSKVYNNSVKRISDAKIPNFHELRHYYAIEHQKRYLEQNPSLKSMDSQSLEEHLGLFRRKVLGHKMINDSTRPYKTLK